MFVGLPEAAPVVSTACKVRAHDGHGGVALLGARGRAKGEDSRRAGVREDGGRAQARDVVPIVERDAEFGRSHVQQVA